MRHLVSVFVYGLSFAVFLAMGVKSIVVFDEGFILTGAMMILNGKLPYKDFLTMYGPGQYYLYAGIFAVFGQTLMVSKLAHAAIMAGAVLAIHSLARRLSGGDQRAAAIVWAGVMGVLVYSDMPSSIASYPAVLLILWSVVVFSLPAMAQPRKLVLCSVLLALAGWIRWDFGIFAILAFCGAIVFSAFLPGGRQDGKGIVARTVQELALMVGPFAILMALVYAYSLVLVSDPLRWWNEVILFAIREFEKWRGLAYVKPVYWGLSGGLSGVFSGDFRIQPLLDALLLLAALVLPLFLIGRSLVALAAVARAQRSGWTVAARSRWAGIIALSFATLLMLNQLRVRSDFAHGLSALMACLPLLAARASDVATGLRLGYRSVLDTSAAAWLASGAALLLLGVGLQQFLATPTVELTARRALGVSVRADMPTYDALIHYVESQTAKGEIIYSGVLDHSRLFVCDPMLYFLADRMPADRFMELEPGISNTVPAQNEIVAALKQHDVRFIVLLDRVSDEPNRSAVSNGVHILDDYIRANYQVVREFGKHRIFKKMPVSAEGN